MTTNHILTTTLPASENFSVLVILLFTHL